MKTFLFVLIVGCAIKVYIQDNTDIFTHTSTSEIGNEERRDINDIIPQELNQHLGPIAPAIVESQPEKMVTFADIAEFSSNCTGIERTKAIHEAGHFLVYCLLDMVLTKATIVNQGNNIGGFVQAASKNSIEPQRELTEAAGYAAEIMFITHHKSVENYMRQSGFFKRKLADNEDLAALINQTDKTAAYNKVVEACQLLNNRKNEILAIASCLYRKKTLTENECAWLKAEILGKEVEND
jgi:hypothetical protein